MKNNNNHSFYKEANKSILGQQQMTPKKIFKGIFKGLKWLLFLFLIVITLWGCVNEFIIQTSKSPGQGVEFYQDDDFVYPNLYQGVEFVGYEAKDGTEVGTEVGTKADDKPGDHIYVVNPAYGVNALTEDQVSVTTGEKADFITQVKDNAANLWIPASQSVSVTWNDDKITAKTVSQKEQPYTYNLNEYSYLLTGMSNYKTTDLIKDGHIYLPTNVIPNLYYKDKWTDDWTVDNTAKTTKEYVWSALQNDASTLGKVDKEAPITLSASEAVIAKEPIFNWKEGVALDEGSEVKYDDLIGVNGNIGAVNPYSPTVPYYVTKNFKGYGYDDDQMNYASLVNYNAFIQNTAVTEVNGVDAPTDYDKTYSADYSSAFTSLKQGAQILVVPVQKGMPISLSQESKDLVDSFRPADFTNVYDQYVDDSRWKKGDSFDPETMMYGWALAGSKENEDGTHDLIKLYDDASLTESTEESNYMFADQRHDGWGVIDSEGNNIMTNAPSDITVFDDQINTTWQGKYLSVEREDSNGNSYSVAVPFSGITTINEIQKFDSSFMGTTAKKDETWIGDNDDGQRSLLSDSIIASGQDSYGESRVAFVGWEDWGKAWEIQYGPLYGTVVFPLAQIAMGVGEWFDYQSHPWGTLGSIALIVFFTRGLAALFSIKGTKNQLKMQEVQTEVAKIKARYSKYDLKADSRMKQKQQQEIMALYRKNDVNPMGSLGTIFITMPIFISLWIIISALPAYKLVIMGNFSWAVSAWSGIFAGAGGGLFLIYLMVGISVGLVQGISSKLPSWLANKRKGIKRLDESTKEANKKNNRTQNIMIGVFVFMGLTVPALFAFYWICSGLFTILLELMRHGWRTHTAKMIKQDPSYETPGVKLSKNIKESFNKAVKSK